MLEKDNLQSTCITMQIISDTHKSMVTFRNIPENTIIEIYNLDGRMVKKLSSVCHDFNLDISFLKKGLYMIKTHSNGYFLSELLVKE